LLEWKSPCVDDGYFCEELFIDEVKPVERPLDNEILLVFGNRCVEPCESDSDNNIDVDGGVVWDEEFENGWDERGGGAVEYTGFGIRKSEWRTLGWWIVPPREAADEDVDELVGVLLILLRIIRPFDGTVVDVGCDDDDWYSGRTIFVFIEYGSTFATFLRRVVVIWSWSFKRRKR